MFDDNMNPDPNATPADDQPMTDDVAGTTPPPADDAPMDQPADTPADTGNTEETPETPAQ